MIDKNSSLIVEKKRTNEDIHERLYEIARKQNLMQKEKKKEEEAKKEMLIRKSRQNAVPDEECKELKLYELAVKKRQEMERKAKEKKPKEANKPSNDPLIINCFIKEYNKTLKELKLEDSFDYEQVKSILKAMRFIPEEIKGKAELLAEALWDTVKVNKVVTKNSLMNYLGAILNLSLSDNDSGKEVFTPQEINHISLKYRLLALNRRAKKVVKEKKEEEATFKPMICEKSIKMAENHREKYVTGIDDKDPLVQLANTMAMKKEAQEK
jgi:hypothetical protein